MESKNLENKVTELEIQIQALQDELMYLRSALADLLQSAIAQKAIEPSLLLRKMKDYKYAPFSWVRKYERKDIYKRHLYLIEDLTLAIDLGIRDAIKNTEKTLLESSIDSKEILSYILEKIER